MREGTHQYVDRVSGSVRDERLYWDSAIRFLYSPVREKAPRLFAAMTSPRMSSFLGFLNYDSFVGRCFSGGRRFMLSCSMDWTECLDHRTVCAHWPRSSSARFATGSWPAHEQGRARRVSPADSSDGVWLVRKDGTSPSALKGNSSTSRSCWASGPGARRLPTAIGMPFSMTAGKIPL